MLRSLVVVMPAPVSYRSIPQGMEQGERSQPPPKAESSDDYRPHRHSGGGLPPERGGQEAPGYEQGKDDDGHGQVVGQQVGQTHQGQGDDSEFWRVADQEVPPEVPEGLDHLHWTSEGSEGLTTGATVRISAL